MPSKKLIIVNKLGLHARAAAKFVTCASRFGARIQVSKNGQRVDGKSIMGVMLLAASQGSEITIEAEGDDADVALIDLAELVAGRFGEDQ